MGIFDYFRKKKIDNIVETEKKKNIGKRYLMLLLGCLIVAFSFNLFIASFNAIFICLSLIIFITSA